MGCEYNMENNFTRTMEKIAKKDSDMKQFYEYYLSKQDENAILAMACQRYWPLKNVVDKRLDITLIDLAREKNWLDENNEKIDFKKIPEIIELYLEQKELVLETGPKIMRKMNEIANDVDELNLGFFEQINSESKETIKELLSIKIQITDIGVHCLTYLASIRLCFAGFSLEEGFNLVKMKINLKENDEAILDENFKKIYGLTVGMDILSQLVELLTN